MICNSGHRLGCMNSYKLYSAETHAVAFVCSGETAIHYTNMQQKTAQASSGKPFAEAVSYRYSLERGKQQSLQKVSMSSKTSQTHVSCSPIKA